MIVDLVGKQFYIIYFIINTISKLFTLALVPLVYRPKITDHS